MIGDGKGLLGAPGAPGNDDPTRYSASTGVAPGFAGHPRQDFALSGGFPHMDGLSGPEDHQFPPDAYGNLLFQPGMLDGAYNHDPAFSLLRAWQLPRVAALS